MQRYFVGSEGPSPAMVEDKDGHYVLFSEVDAEIAALQMYKDATLNKESERERQIVALTQRVKELEAALRLNLAVSPDDPILVTPAEKGIVSLWESGREWFDRGTIKNGKRSGK